jgi:LPXTG-motif cell wall-anchored protein
MVNAYQKTIAGGWEYELAELKKQQSKASKSHSSGLEKSVSSVIAIAGVLGGIFFLSTNVTGNAIADLTTKTTSFLGAGLLIVGLVAGFFWVKSRKK